MRRVSQLVLWLVGAVVGGGGGVFRCHSEPQGRVASRRGRVAKGERDEKTCTGTSFLGSRPFLSLSPLKSWPLSLDRDGKYRTRWGWRVRLPRKAAPGDFGVNNSEVFALGVHVVSFLPAC